MSLRLYRYNFCAGYGYLSSLLYRESGLLALKFMVFFYLQLAKLVEMGFSEDIARSTLEACGGDENAALEKLCIG